MRAQVTESLLPTCENKSEFLAPSLGPDQSWTKKVHYSFLCAPLVSLCPTPTWFLFLKNLVAFCYCKMLPLSHNHKALKTDFVSKLSICRGRICYAESLGDTTKQLSAWKSGPITQIMLLSN